jgi:hypothetical protein
MVIDFEELQQLAGCRQQSKVIDWLKASHIPFVIGYDGKPRTTHNWLEKWNEPSKEVTEIRFKVG